MPLQKLQFRPGINREGTNYSNEGGWYECDKIRFRSGYPEKIGGWTRATASFNYDGVCRLLVNWVDLDQNNLVGVGTHLKYYINNGLGRFNNITPIRKTTNPMGANPFSAVSGSTLLTVTDTVHGAQVNDFVTFSGVTTFAGIPADALNKEHQIVNVVNANTYEIRVTFAANTTATGGGSAVVARYQLNVGLPVYSVGNGFGAGVWNGANLSISTDLTYTSGTRNILLDAISTTINATTTVGFANSGTLVIDSEVITYSGKTSTSFTGCTRGVQNNVVRGSSTLASAINSSVTTIPVANVSSFTVPTLGSVGVVRVANEIITYSGVNVATNSLTGCVRGAMGTTAASQLSGAAIAEYAGVQHGLDPTTGSATPPPIKIYQATNFLGTTGWGLASNITFGAGVGQQMRLWTSDTYGEDLLIAPRGGDLYYWQNNTATFPAAITLQAAAAAAGLVAEAPFVPNTTNQVVVSDVSRFVIAMGSNSYNPSDPNTPFDPLLVRWSEQEDAFNWIQSPTTQAGEQRLTNGSFIMQAKKTRQEILIWTDAAVYSMQFLGPPYTFGFQLLMDNLSIMSPNSAIVVNNVAYWMGTDKFYTYSGRVETLPCALRQYIFNDINYDQRFQIVCGSNEGYNEVWWYYVSNTEVARAAEESRDPIIDRYVVYNHLERIWYYGNLSRTFWLDTPIQQFPLAAAPLQASSALSSEINDSATSITLLTVENFTEIGTVLIDSEQISYAGISGNTLQNCVRGVNSTTAASHSANSTVSQVASYTGSLLFHESGNDDVSTSSAKPFTAYIQSSDFDIGDGHNLGFVWRVIPDITFTGSNSGTPQVEMILKPRNYSGSPYGTAGINDVTSAQTYTPVVKSYAVEQYTPQVYTRIRGRQMAFRLESSGQTGVAWQLGSPRIDIRPDGRR